MSLTGSTNVNIFYLDWFRVGIKLLHSYSVKTAHFQNFLMLFSSGELVVAITGLFYRKRLRFKTVYLGLWRWVRRIYFCL